MNESSVNASKTDPKEQDRNRVPFPSIANEEFKSINMPTTAPVVEGESKDTSSAGTSLKVVSEMENDSVDQTTCLHPSYKLFYNNPDADGVDEVQLRDYICNACDKKLAHGWECISASGVEVYDLEWEKRAGVEDGMY